MRKLIYNAIQTPDGTIIESRHRHDFVVYTDKNSKEYMVDGGIDYLRRNVHTDAPYIELALYDDAPHEEQRAFLSWGTYGKSGKEPLKYVKVADMSTAHLIKVIFLKGLSRDLYCCMAKELLQREIPE